VYLTDSDIQLDLGDRVHLPPISTGQSPRARNLTDLGKCHKPNSQWEFEHGSTRQLLSPESHLR